LHNDEKFDKCLSQYTVSFLHLESHVYFDLNFNFRSIYAVDRELIFPKVYDNYFPEYVNHMLHTTVLPFQVKNSNLIHSYIIWIKNFLFQALELYLAYHVYPKRTLGIFTTAVFCLTYIGWTLVVANQSGIWVYRVLEVLTPIERLNFYYRINFS